MIGGGGAAAVVDAVVVVKETAAAEVVTEVPPATPTLTSTISTYNDHHDSHLLYTPTKTSKSVAMAVALPGSKQAWHDSPYGLYKEVKRLSIVFEGGREGV